MKVYISVDMEGISGVVLREQVSKGTPEYAEARKLLIGDANAAVAGALEGGATEVLVKDAHGSGFNFPLEDLHPQAEYIMGPSSPERFPWLEEFDAMFLVGYHAMSGTPHAIRDHTMSSASWQQFFLNGREMGEVGIDAAYAGAFGVPIALVTGDDKVCAEAQALLGEIPVAVVKRALGRHSGRIVPPAVARDLIRRKACEAMGRINQIKPFRVESPCEAQIKYASTDIVDGMRMDGDLISRINGQTVAFRGKDVLEVFGRAIH